MLSKPSAYKHRPKKRFSQNFLVNLNAARRIVDSLDLSPEETVLEIGAGKGVLTQFLIEKAKKVWAVELDHHLVQALREKFAANGNLQIVSGDILKIKLTDYLQPRERIKIVGNLPYQITSPILEWIVNQKEFIKQAVITVQKEVAKRICARPGTREWSPISIFCQVYFKPSLLFTLSPGSFFPTPKVHSAVVRLDVLSEPLVPETEQRAFFRLVKVIFSTRRKTLVRSLSDHLCLPKNLLAPKLSILGLGAKIRGETLSIAQLLELNSTLKQLSS